MTIRHATALALLGWFLMVPQILAPQAPGAKYLIGPMTANSEPDFPSWRQAGIFDTQAACESAREELPGMLTYKSPVPKDTIARVAKLAQCVADDDPRLKPN
jgi:hypothetical protein